MGTSTFPLDTRKHQSRFEYEEQLVEWKLCLRRYTRYGDVWCQRMTTAMWRGRHYLFWKTMLFQANDTGVCALVKFPEHCGGTHHIVIRYQFCASCLWYSELRLTTMLRMPSLNPWYHCLSSFSREASLEGLRSYQEQRPANDFATARFNFMVSEKGRLIGRLIMLIWSWGSNLKMRIPNQLLSCDMWRRTLLA